MLSSEVNQNELMVKRIEQVVSTIMAEDPLFARDLDYLSIVEYLVSILSIVEYLVSIFNQALSVEEFNTISDASLKNRCSKIMAVQLLAKIGEDFTPEQMAIFEEAIKRK
jgi:hypothetical protein